MDRNSVPTNEPPNYDQLVVSIPRARDLLGGLGRTTLYNEIAAGRLERVKIGNRSFITMRSIRERVGEA